MCSHVGWTGPDAIGLQEPLYDEDTTWMYFDKVIFLDGSFFCGFDVIEMLKHKNASITCGLDVVHPCDGPADGHDDRPADGHADGQADEVMRNEIISILRESATEQATISQI